MARKTSSKPDSGPSSTATIGFERADGRWQPSGARQTAAGSPKGERGGANQYRAVSVFGVPAEAGWALLQANANQPTLATLRDTQLPKLLSAELEAKLL